MRRQNWLVLDNHWLIRPQRASHTSKAVAPSSAAGWWQLPAVFAGPAAEGGDKRVQGFAKWGEGVRDGMLV